MVEGRRELDSAFNVGAYKSAFRHIGVPALITDTDFVIRDINAAGTEFTGYAYNELVGKPATAIAGDEEIYAEIVQTIMNDQVWSGGFELQTKDRRLVFGEGSAAPVFVNGEKKGYVAIFIGTKRKKYENTTEVLNRLLRHDLRNDMNVLYGYLQLAESLIDNDTVSDYLIEAREQAIEIINKSERARDLKTVLEKSYEMSNQPVRLDYALNEAIVRTTDEYNNADFQFTDCPAIHVVADDFLPTAFESVIENAVVHNDKETPKIEIAHEERETDVLVRIRDNGPGVPEESEEMIFGRAEESQLHHGTGISLFFTNNVIEHYNGDIWIEQNQSEGSTFVIRLNKP